jgi:hypothetical protein
MASADDYAAWIVANQDKQGTPEFDTVAKAYQLAKQDAATGTQGAPNEGFGTNPALPSLAGGVIEGLTSPILSTVAGVTPIESKDLRSALRGGLQTMLGASPESGAYTAGQMLGGTAVTAPVARGLGAAAARLPGLSPALVNAIRTGGFGGGGVLPRAAGGAITGGVTAGLLNPEDIGTGAGIGAAIPVVGAPVAGAAAKATGRAVDWLTGAAGPELKAAEIARQAAGPQLPDVMRLLENAPATMTGRQTIESASARPLQALGAAAESTLGGVNYYPVKEAAQRESTRNALAEMAMGGTRTEARQAREAARATVERVTGKTREQELQRVSDASKAAQQLETDESMLYGNQAHNYEYRREAMRQAGVGPLNISAVTNNLRGKAAAPGNRADELTSGVLSRLADKMDELTARNGGVMDPYDWYELRKSGINDTIESLMSGKGKPDKARTAAILTNVRSLMDDAMEKAGATEWRNYLTSYSSGMKEVEKRQLADEALKRFDKSPQSYVDFIRGNDPKAVEKILGKGNYDIRAALGPDYADLNNVATMVERNKSIAQQAEEGKDVANKLLQQQRPFVRRLFDLVPHGSTANNVIDLLARNGVDDAVREALAQGFRSGRTLRSLLSTLPAVERNSVLRALNKPGEYQNIGTLTSAGTAAATTD